MEHGTETDHGSDRLREIAQGCDYFLESDICLLYNITEKTAEAWRKRGTGPAYVLAGRTYLYPRSAVLADLKSRTRERTRSSAGAMI